MAVCFLEVDKNPRKEVRGVVVEQILPFGSLDMANDDILCAIMEEVVGRELNHGRKHIHRDTGVY